MERDIYKIKFNMNYLYIIILISILSFVYFIAPVWFKNQTEILILFSLMGLFPHPLWVLIHDSIHGVLFKNQKENDFWGKILSMYLGAPFRILQAGHLLHHGYNRTREEVTDLYNPHQTTKIIANIKYYFWILQGLYISEILSNFVFLIPSQYLSKLKNHHKGKSNLKYNLISFMIIREKEIKWEGFINVIFYSIIFLLYAENSYIFLMFLAFRGLMISLFDNVYHYGTKENDILFGYNLIIPNFLKFYFLNSNFHGLHHQKPKIPWFELENEFINMNKTFDGHLFPQLFRQLKGAIPNQKL